MKTVVLDNYDSFTYNLVYLLETLSKQKVEVIRNDQVNAKDLLRFDQIVLSPGPGIPQEAGILCEVVKECYQTHKILGICLGHQAIAEVFGGSLVNMKNVKHGIASSIALEADPIFEGLPATIEVGRYHSWNVADPLPQGFKVIARDEENEIMALKHNHFSLYGLQFHPESILTPDGATIIQNWLSLPL